MSDYVPEEIPDIDPDFGVDWIAEQVDPVDQADSQDQPDVPGTVPAQDIAALAQLSLWDVLARGVHTPRGTWKTFWATVRSDESAAVADESVVMAQAAVVDSPVSEQSAVAQVKALTRSGIERGGVVPLLLLFTGVISGIAGSVIMSSGATRTEEQQLHAGAPWLLQGFLLWLIAWVVLYRVPLLAEIRGWPARLTFPAKPQEGEASRKSRQSSSFTAWVSDYQERLIWVLSGLLLSAGAYFANGNNQFTLIGVIIWLGSIGVWLLALSPVGADLRLESFGRQVLGWRVGEFRLRFSPTLIALVVIMIAAAFFRLHQFEAVPPEMTSDHVEKLLDAQRVLDGTTQVFFPNNGGREPLQMYLVALFSKVSGLGMQFATLKWVSILEALLTIPVLWWMGRELIGEKQRDLGNRVGLLLAAFVAVSYWHVALSRLSLRIILTPLVMALVLIYLARGMRFNRRGDFLKAGLALGFGVYTYQAVRMIPVVVVVGVVLAFFFRARDWAERGRYAANLAALVLITLVIFVPLGRFMLESPNLFWMRTSGRLLGDDVITETDPDTGEITEREATVDDRITAFKANMDVLGSNVRNVVLMFNWKGDVAWINGAPNEPALDIFAGTFFILGLAAWLVRMVRRRDVVDWLILPALFIMLLPSALSIAFPVENPSATRTSGSLPFVYLLVAYGVAVLFSLFERTFRSRYSQGVSVAVAVLLIGGSYSANSALYFGRYADRYTIAAQPYSQTGRILRGFAESGGSYGNAFMVAYPYWFDHRAIGIEGGRIDWPNGLVELDDLAQKIRDNVGTEYAFDPARSVLFFYHQNDEETPAVLAEWFPGGVTLLQENAQGMTTKDFYTYTAPPPGNDWLLRFWASYPVEE